MTFSTRRTVFAFLVLGLATYAGPTRTISAQAPPGYCSAINQNPYPSYIRAFNSSGGFLWVMYPDLQQNTLETKQLCEDYIETALDSWTYFGCEYIDPSAHSVEAGAYGCYEAVCDLPRYDHRYCD